MNKWMCLKCHAVFLGGNGKCCGVEAELFDLQKSENIIVGGSNAWIRVHEKWKDNETFKAVVHELHEDGCYSAATAMNVFIQRLSEERENK